MKNYFKTGGTFTNVDVTKLEEFEDNDLRLDIAWSTEKVNKLLDDYRDGNVELSNLRNSPFVDNNIMYRKPGLTFLYTKEEMNELRKCSKDPIYFAANYCKLFTEDGHEIVSIRDYQQGLLEGMAAHNNCVLLCSRQLGKTSTTAMFILWYILFNKEKNVLILGNKYVTTKETIGKVKELMDRLPFFMKPGLVKNNEASVIIDNGCRIIGRTTTKDSGIGLTINFLYIDEFAHINPGIINDFWKATYPTVSAMKNSRIVITSTPNGLNKFHEIWTSAVDAIESEGKSSFFPMRVDWWQVPGRDENWKAQAIADIGSIEMFNQEYGLQFFSGDNLLLNSSDIKKLYNIKTKFLSRPIKALTLDKTYYDSTQHKTKKVLTDFSEYMTWHPKFLELYFTKDMQDLKSDDNYYVFGIDTSKGVGKDYHVLNIFKVVPMSMNRLMMNKNNIIKHTDIFSLVQVGMFRINSVNAETFSDIVSTIVYDIFDVDHVRIGLELNVNGVLVRSKLENNIKYWDGLILWTKRNEENNTWEPGTDLSSNKVKSRMCEKFQYYVSVDRFITTEEVTFSEVSNFGSNAGRTIYRCQVGHDDIMLSCIHASAFMSSYQFEEICSELFDKIRDREYLRKLDKDVIDYNIQRLGTDNEIKPSDLVIIS